MTIIKSSLNTSSEEFRTRYAHNKKLLAELREMQRVARHVRPQRDLDRLSKQGKMLPRERLDWSPVSRATLLHLDRWVGANTVPPASRVMPLEPATGDKEVLGAPAYLPKAVVERPRRDADGNVTGGVRLPDVAVPLGTHAAQQDPPSFSCALAGAFLPFATTKEARETNKDPRPSIAERYAGRDDYVNRIRIAARALQADGFLLPDDAAVIIAAAAAKQWEAATKE